MKKTESNRCIVFAAVELNTVSMEAGLPKDNLIKWHTLVDEHRKKDKISVHDLESLTEALNFTTGVVAPGTPFLQQLYQLLWGFSWFKLRLTREAWEEQKYSGVAIVLPKDWSDNSVLHFLLPQQKDAYAHLGALQVSRSLFP